jgi:hypothetical protein
VEQNQHVNLLINKSIGWIDVGMGWIGSFVADYKKEIIGLGFLFLASKIFKINLKTGGRS